MSKKNLALALVYLVAVLIIGACLYLDMRREVMIYQALEQMLK